MLLCFLFVISSLMYHIYSKLEYIPFSSNQKVKVNVFRKIENDAGIVHALTVPIGSIISHCDIGKPSDPAVIIDKKLPFRLGTGFVGPDRKTLKWTRCLSKNNAWIYENSYFNCPVFDTFVDFLTIFDLGDEEIVVITCKTINEEYIYELNVEEHPKIQVVKLFSNLQRTVTTLPDIYLPHGDKLSCISNFPLSPDISWKKLSNNSHPDYSCGQFLKIDLDLTNPLVDLEQQLNEYQCTLKYIINDKSMDISAKYKFFVQINYTAQFLDSLGTSKRLSFDVGETISCKTSPKAKITNAYIWYNSSGQLGLAETAESTTYIQTPKQFLTIANMIGKLLPIKLFGICFIEGQNNIKYKIFTAEISILTTSTTTYLHSSINTSMAQFTDMRCSDSGYSIYLFILSRYQLPLSTAFNDSNLVNAKDNVSVSLPHDFDSNMTYFLVCKSAQDIKTPKELDLSAINEVYISPIFPSFIKPTTKHIKGFVFECRTNSKGISVNWLCTQCTYAQRQQTLKNSDQSEYLFIISDFDMVITYECVGKDGTRITKKPLILNIYGDMLPMIKSPRYFYALGDPVFCTASRYQPNMFDIIEVPLPVKLTYVSTPPHTEIITGNDFDFNNETFWSPKIPDYLSLDYKNMIWKFSACCLKYEKNSNSMICGDVINLNVVVNYTFKYNYDISTVIIYPGNAIKCCILRRTSLEPKKIIWDGDNRYNCLTAMIVFYANKERSATPENSGDLLFEGLQVVVPDKYLGNDITKAATFVKCFTENYVRKEADLKRSGIQLQIKSCAISPPALIMLPSDQTLFLVNNTISCVPASDECKSSLIFDFKIERGGILIDKIEATTMIVLINKYLGKNIRVTCELGTTYALRDISVERLPHSIVIKGHQRIMTINSVIICESDGFPEPHIVWTQTNGTSLLKVEDYAILIRNWDRNGHYDFVCTAFNKHGESSMSIAFEIFNVNMRDTYYSRQFYIIIYIELILYHCLLLVIVYFLFKDYLYKHRHVSKQIIRPKKGEEKLQ